MHTLRKGYLWFLILTFFTGCVAPMKTPPLLSHFKCYVVDGREPEGQYVVQLSDQFGPSRTAVGRPKYLCTPVEKVVQQGRPREVVGKPDHLTCYIIAGRQTGARGIQNQLDQQNLSLERAELLCVPTVKGEPFPEVPHSQ